jgi:hypothetical protein
MAVAGGDWRDAGLYARLLSGDRRCFAWEWLRRTDAYLHAWSTVGPADPFGLVRLENPDLDALSARPVWSAAIDIGVLRATGHAATEDEGFAFSRFGSLMTMVAAEEGHTPILLSDGLRSIRVDLTVGASPSSPLLLTWHIIGIHGLGRQIAALSQFAALVRHGRFLPSRHIRERRAVRWIQMLRVHDALAVGASTREIVALLFGIDTTRPRWRTDAGSWRLRVQRLAAAARVCLAAGPAEWLSDQGG